MRQLKRALQPALTNVTIDWGDFVDVVQAPRKLRTLFNGDRLLVYGFLRKLLVGTVTLKATSPKGPVSFAVAIDPHNERKGRLINILAARTRIRDLEEDSEPDQAEIVRLGITYQLASSQTSFVAAEVLESEAKGKRLNLSRSTDMLPLDSKELSRSVSSENLAKPAPSTTAPAKNIPLPSFAIPSSPSQGRGTKKTYTQEFLLRFQPMCSDLPEGLNPIGIHTKIHVILLINQEVILGNTRKPDRNEPKSPKGGKRGTPAKQGHKRSQSGGKGSTPRKGPKDSKPENLAPVAPLVQSENRWIRPAASGDTEAIFRKAQGYEF
jgi:hypothetical protein